MKANRIFYKYNILSNKDPSTAILTYTQLRYLSNDAKKSNHSNISDMVKVEILSFFKTFAKVHFFITERC